MSNAQTLPHGLPAWMPNGHISTGVAEVSQCRSVHKAQGQGLVRVRHSEGPTI